MARKSKLDAWQEVEEAFKPGPRKTTHKMSKQALFKDPDVRHAYEALIEARRLFLLQHIYVTQVKQYFQDVVDPELVHKKKIFQSKFWEFILDDDGNMHYKDSDESYEDKANEFIEKARSRSTRGTKFDDDDITWEKKGTSKKPENPIPGVPRDTSKDVAEGTNSITANTEPEDLGLSENFAGNEEAYLDYYDKLPTIAEQHAFFAYIITDDEKVDFYKELSSNKKRTRLYKVMTDKEKTLIDEAKIQINPPESAE